MSKTTSPSLAARLSLTETPYLQSQHAVLLHTDVRNGLRMLPAESIHCVITSPPYLGLRRYGTEPQVWGGDVACRHEWEETRHYKDSPTRTGIEGTGFSNPETTRQQRWGISETCTRCGAWRGELGGEKLHDCLAWARGEPPCSCCYICHIRMILRELSRVLRQDGTLWWVVGDSYSSSGGAGGDYSLGGLKDGQARYPGRNVPGMKPKNLVGIPWRTALAAQADGWTLRSDIVWHKRNSLPESVRDRPTRSHEHVLLLTRGESYFYDHVAIMEPLARPEALIRGKPAVFGGRKAAGYGSRLTSGNAYRNPVPGRNRRDVWNITTSGFKGAHFATFPERLVELCLKAGTSEEGGCVKCGTPWRRNIQRGAPLTDWKRRCGADGNGRYQGHDTKDYPVQGIQVPGDVKSRILDGMREWVTTGWEPQCSCDSTPTEPCVVLDPFAGSGTTGAASLRLERAFIGIELNAGYCAIAAQRLEQSAPARSSVKDSCSDQKERPKGSPFVLGARP